jgi:hypothetical protein
LWHSIRHPPGQAILPRAGRCVPLSRITAATRASSSENSKSAGQQNSGGHARRNAGRSHAPNHNRQGSPSGLLNESPNWATSARETIMATISYATRLSKLIALVCVIALVPTVSGCGSPGDLVGQVMSRLSQQLQAIIARAGRADSVLLTFKTATSRVCGTDPCSSC